MDTHTCPTCHTEKPLNEFHRRTRGVTGRCRTCRNAQSRQSYAKHREKVIAHQAAYVRQKRQAHDAEFLAKRRAIQQKRRQTHPGEDAAIAKAYRQRHPDRVKATKKASWQRRGAIQKAAEQNRKRTYRLHNRAQVKAVHLRWRQANPAKVAASHFRRRAWKAAAPRNDFTAEQWEMILAAFDYRCAYCHKKKTPLTQDHITPYVHGGSNTLWNIVPACKSCNSKKGVNPPLIPVQPLLL